MKLEIEKHKPNWLLSLLLVLFACVPTANCQAPARQKIADQRIEFALAWAPVSTRALLVTSVADYLDDSDLSVMRPDFGWQLGALRPVWPLADEFGVKDISICVDCIEKSPESCQFLFLKDNPQLDDKLRKYFAENARTSRTESGFKVYQLKAVQTASAPKPADYCFSMPQKGLIVGATNPALMRSVLERMADKGLQGEAPIALVDLWQRLDTNTPFWGLNRFSANDSFSPSYKNDALDKAALGMNFSYDPSKSKAVVNYFSSSKKAASYARQISGQPTDSACDSSEKGLCSLPVVAKEGEFPHALWNSLTRYLGDKPKD